MNIEEKDDRRTRRATFWVGKEDLFHNRGWRYIAGERVEVNV